MVVPLHRLTGSKLSMKTELLNNLALNNLKSVHFYVNLKIELKNTYIFIHYD